MALDKKLLDLVTRKEKARLGEAVRFLAPDIILYALTVLAVHVLFAVLNGHYTILAARGAASRWPPWRRFFSQAAGRSLRCVMVCSHQGERKRAYPSVLTDQDEHTSGPNLFVTGP